MKTRFGRGSVLVGGVLSLAVVLSGLSPAAAAPEPAAGETAAVGGFGIGDQLEALIDDRDGSVRLSAPLAGLGLAWDSRAVTAGDLTGLGPGWGLGLTRIGVRGAHTVYPPTGGAYTVDATQASGLAGYGVHDLRFEAEAGILEARADGAAGEIGYAYVLAELGGTVTYFDAGGRPVARVTARGPRADWRWEEAGTAGRLRSAVSADGVVTELDWASDPGAVLVRSGANLPAEPGVSRAWRLDLNGGRVVRIEDPEGGRFDIEYVDELIGRTRAPSGAVTELQWQALDDRVPRIATVRVTDRDGAELSVRRWRPLGAELSSGWPAYGGESQLFLSRDDGFRYITELSDGATLVRSTYRSLHVLESRELVVTGPSGEQVVREERFGYPGADGSELPDPRALPGNWSRPVEAAVTYRDRQGAARVARTQQVVDDLGRPVRAVGVDGTVIETEYAPGHPGDLRPPVGLAVRERVTAPDGAVEETRHTLDDSGSAVIATETLAGDDVGSLTITSRIEFTVEPDGFVSEQRDFPDGDPSQAPVTTRWQASVDLVRGERTVTETAAAGTTVETVSSTTTSLVHGGVLAEVDAVGNRSSAAYDALGRVVRATDAAGRTTSTAYDRETADGRNAIVTTAPDGVTRTDHLDVLGRVERVTDDLAQGVPTPGHERLVERRQYPDPSTVVVTDAWGGVSTARQDVFGREVELISAGGSITRTEYDEVANTVTRWVTAEAGTAPEMVSVERLDASGRAVESTGERADGVAVPTVTTAYDGLGRVRETDDGTLGTRVEYDARGLPTRTHADPHEDDGDGVADTVTERRFDGFGASLEKTLSAGADTASAGTRELDELGRVRREVDATGRESRFEYTPDGLLTRIEAGSGQVVEREYDPVTRELIGIVTTSPAGAEVREAIEYDAIGLPMRALDGTEYHYDAANRLVTEIRDGRRTDTSYWADGTRRGRSADTGEVIFYWDGDTLLSEEHRDASRADADTTRENPEAGTASYLVGVDRHARTVTATGSAPETVYYGTDRHGSVTELTDAAGGIAERYRYGDYGEVSTATAETEASGAGPSGLRRNPFRYAGAYTEPAGTQWLSVRTYDPVSMRFTSQDEADLLNGYAYADLNPVMMVDPSGRASQWDWTVDGVLFSLNVALFVGATVGAVFSGGWSLSVLGIAGMVADAAVIASSVVRIDAIATGKVIDPAVDTAMFFGEIALSVFSGFAAAHTLRAMPRALQLQQAESKLQFLPLERIGAYPGPKAMADRWIRTNGGTVDDTLRTAINARFTRDRMLIDDARTHQKGRLDATKQLIKDVSSISEASRGSWLTRPIRATFIERRVSEQTRQILRNIDRLKAHSVRWWKEWASTDLVPRAGLRRGSDAPRATPDLTRPAPGDGEHWYPPAESRAHAPVVVRANSLIPPRVLRFD